jgi:hypothetical protein
MRRIAMWLLCSGICLLEAFVFGCGGGTRGRTVSLNISSEPPGARVYIEGDFVGTTPFTTAFQYQHRGAWARGRGRELPECDPAVITVSAYKPGYFPQTRQINVARQLATSPNGTYSFLLLLAPATEEAHPTAQQQQMLGPTIVIGGEPVVVSGQSAQDTGSVIVSSDPAGAEVFVDDVSVGKTPVAVQQKAGAHKVRIVLAGYKEVSQAITVKAGESMNLIISLSRQENPSG